MKKIYAALMQRKAKAMWAALALLGVATVSYEAGLSVLYMPLLLWILARYMPLPSIFRSTVSRVVVSLFLFYGLFQLAVVVQFFMLPDSGFKALALLTAILTAVLVIVARTRGPHPIQGPIVDRNDVAAGIAVACFAVPLVVLGGMWQGDPVAIARLAGVQSYDAVNHFMGELEMGTAQHLTYRTVDYYPKGFHITTMFIQHSIGLDATQLGWVSTARLFIGQYLVFGMLLAYILVYGCLAAYRAIMRRAAGWFTGTTMGFTLGVTAALFYLLPFTHQGFINYYYSIASAVCGLVYLLDLFRRPPGAFRPHWYVFGYFLLIFGLSMSWPLLIPPFLVIGLLCMVPERNLFAIASYRSWGFLAASTGVLLQGIPVYFQMKYWALSTGSGLNTPGSITAFHYGLLLAGLALVMYVVLRSGFPDQIRRFVTVVFFPLYLFVGALVAYQYFTAGEVRYFAIKVAYSLEILLLVLAVAIIVRWFAAGSVSRLYGWAVPAVIMVLTVLLLNGITANPLQDEREMFRQWSHFGTPVFYETDTARLVDLGVGSKLGNSNAVVLHFDAATQTMYGNLPVSKWANVMQTGRHISHPARTCADDLFPIAMYQAVSPAQQAAVRTVLQRCITLTNNDGRTFYVVTDDASELYLRSLFTGDVVFVR